MAAATATDVQKAYLAYFGRPADPVGLAYWTGKDTATMKDGFAASTEYAALYANMTSTQMVSQVYTNLLGRSADAAGLLYWAGELAAGRQTVGSLVDSMQANALGDDVTTINNRVTYATAFTAALDTAAEIVAYSGTTAADSARAAVLTVTTDASLTTATTALSTTITTVTTAGATTAGTTYTLTASGVTGTYDNITGTSGNDTFNANASGLLVTGDVVNGGTGTDTLNSRHTVTADTTISASVSAVETHNVRIDHDGGAADVFTYDMADVSGATKVVMDRANNSAAVADAVFTISGAGFTTAVTTGIKGGDTGADNSSVDLTATYAAVTGSADSATLELDGAAANVVTIASIETLNISALANETSASATGASKLNSLVASSASTVNVSGAGAVKLSGNTDVQVAADFAATVTVDASSNTGGVNFLSEANTLTFTGGSGNDAVYMAGTLTSADTLNGGTGTDTLGLTTDVTAANGATATGFEILDIAGAAGQTFTLADFANSTFTGIAVSAETGTETINNVTSGSTLTIGGTGVITAASDLTVGITNAAVAGHNTDSLAVAITGTGAVDFGTLVVASTESLSIAAGGAATGNSIAVLTAAAAANLTLTGSSALEITAFTSSSALTNIDASAMTGAFVMGAAGAATAATSLKGGSGADTLRGNSGADVILGNGGIDTIYGGAGADDITGGDGADVIVILPGATNTATSVAASATSLTATIANGDSMTFGNGVDIIRGFVSGTDDLKVSDATVVFEGVAPTTLIGATAGDIAEDTIHYARGDFVESTGKFTFSATGADMLIATNDATAADDVLSTNTNIVILTGVTSLAAGDFI